MDSVNESCIFEQAHVQEVANLWLQKKADLQWQCLFLALGLQDDIPVPKPNLSQPLEKNPGGKPLRALAGKPLPAPEGEQLPPHPAPAGKPLPAPEGEPLPPLPAPEGKPDPAPEGDQSSAPVTPKTANGNKKPEDAKPQAEGGLETPEKSGSAPSRIAQCRPADFGQPAEMDTTLKPKKRRKVVEKTGKKTDKEDEKAVVGDSESKNDDPDNSLALRDAGHVSDEDQSM